MVISQDKFGPKKIKSALNFSRPYSKIRPTKFTSHSARHVTERYSVIVMPKIKIQMKIFN